MKIETAELQFIRDNDGDRWFATDEKDHRISGSIEYVYARLIEWGYVTPYPLQKALNDLADCDSDMITYVDRKTAESIIHTLYEEATK